MSPLFVGSLVWKEGSSSVIIDNAATTSNSAVSVFSTASYIFTLTNASQTKIDTLSAGEIVLKQFTNDYSRMKRMHKPTTNAGNFSSYATPEDKKIICERVSFCDIIDFYIASILYRVA